MIIVLGIVIIILFILLQQYEPGFRENIGRAGLLFGTIVVGVTELLSLFNQVTFWGLATAWTIIALSLLGLLAWQNYKSGKIRLHLFLPDLTAAEFTILALLGLFAGIIAIIAIKAPVQTWDSLTYHMARVAHWAEQKNVSFYQTGIERQNFMSPGAEYLTLQAYVLQQGDLFVNIVNWSAYAACIVVASWIAKLLKANRLSQVFAAVFLASIPMAIAQASSTTTDIVLTFWILCVLAEIFKIVHSKQTTIANWVFLGLGIGLAMLTKPTAYVFLFPIIIWFTLVVLKKFGSKAAILSFGLVALLILMVNLGYFMRNTLAYGNPLGPSDVFNYQANAIFSLPVLISNVTRNIALHLGSIHPVNVLIIDVVTAIHKWIGLSINDPRTTLGPNFTVMFPKDEDTIGNFVSLIFICFAYLFLLVKFKQNSGIIKIFGACILISFIIFSSLYRWQLYASRLQLPLFGMSAPFVGYILGENLHTIHVKVGISLLLASAVPWILFLFPRPILPLPNFTDYNTGIFSIPRQELYYANFTSLEDMVTPIITDIKKSNCSQIGLIANGDFPEYLLWMELGKPPTAFRLEWKVVGGPSEKYTQKDFSPCAIICVSCEHYSSKDLKLVKTSGYIDLYMKMATP